MRAAALWGTAGSVLLTAVVAAPASGTAVSPGGPGAAEAHGAAEARGTAVAAQRAASAGIAFGACPASEHLAAELTCGTVTVPLDYAHPDGKQIRLTVSRVGATRTSGGRHPRTVARQGALVYNPGGPGASGMSFPEVSGLSEWRRISAAYDLIGYAPRGVGRSAPLSCQDPKQYVKAPTQSPRDPSDSYKRERMAQAQSYARGCARRAKDALPYYSTLNNARDLDVLRAALGERQITFMGASYGTYVGAVYATLYPSHVRRMVFDSPVNPAPDQIWYQNNLDQSAAFEGRWADFRAWVARNDATYHLGKTPAEVLGSYEQARARLAAEPAGGKVGPGELQAAFMKAGYYDAYWPTRAAALSAFLKGDAGQLTREAAPVAGEAAAMENANAVYTAVECNDAPWPTDWRTWDRDNTRLARVAPFVTWENAWTNLPCAYWSAPRQKPVDVRAASKGALPPTLVLAAERDAAAPYPGALELHRRLAGSALVTEQGSGTHGIGGGANTCVNAYLADYLVDGRLPLQRATACAPHAEPRPVARADTGGRGTRRPPVR
ncbi:alpha/beta hydrolase [Streptomyces sp. NPDC002004]